MKYLFLVFTIVSLQLNAQHEKVELDKFNFEYHDNDSIVRIGDALYNVVTDEVIGFEFSMDTMNNELEEELSSKWLAIDPLYRMFTPMSPYNFALNSPIVFVDPDGRIITFTNDDAQNLYYEYFTQASKEKRAELVKLQDSDIVYEINYQSVPEGSENAGGYTGLKDSKVKDDCGETVISINIHPEEGKNEKQWAINVLGDELVHAGQFESGELGYIVEMELDRKGNIINRRALPAGYDFLDETNSKEGSLDAVKTLGSKPISSAADYKANVLEGDMTKREWIKKYKRVDGKGYKEVFEASGKLGMEQVLSGGIDARTGNTVEEEYYNASIDGYVYRSGGKTKSKEYQPESPKKKKKGN